MNEKIRFGLLTTATLLALAATVSLGSWQLSRAAQKERLQAQIELREKMPPLEGMADLIGAPDQAALIHRRIRLRGRWLVDHTVYLDNRPMNGKVGFYVVTPLLPEGTRTAVLVQRGWMQRNFNDRTQLPDQKTSHDEVEVIGRVAPAPARLYELGAADSGTIRQNLDLPQFAKEIKQPILPLSVLQARSESSAESDGLLREWSAVNAGVDKHYGYAFQWFGLATLIGILYVWFQIVRRFIKPQKT